MTEVLEIPKVDVIKAQIEVEERKDTPVLVDHLRYDVNSKSIPRHSTVFSNICEGEKR